MKTASDVIDAETQQFAVRSAPDELERSITSVHDELNEILVQMVHDLAPNVTVLAARRRETETV